MSSVDVLKPGTVVKVSDSIVGTVLAIRIDPGPSVLYLVSWWDGRVRHEQWLNPVELSLFPFQSDAQLRVGFAGVQP
jgi:hypothetical protein